MKKIFLNFIIILNKIKFYLKLDKLLYNFWNYIYIFNKKIKRSKNIPNLNSFLFNYSIINKILAKNIQKFYTLVIFLYYKTNYNLHYIIAFYYINIRNYPVYTTKSNINSELNKNISNIINDKFKKEISLIFTVLSFPSVYKVKNFKQIMVLFLLLGSSLIMNTGYINCLHFSLIKDLIFYLTLFYYLYLIFNIIVRIYNVFFRMVMFFFHTPTLNTKIVVGYYIHNSLGFILTSFLLYRIDSNLSLFNATLFKDINLYIFIISFLTAVIYITYISNQNIELKEVNTNSLSLFFVILNVFLLSLSLVGLFNLYLFSYTLKYNELIYKLSFKVMGNELSGSETPAPEEIIRGRKLVCANRPIPQQYRNDSIFQYHDDVLNTSNDCSVNSSINNKKLEIGYSTQYLTNNSPCINWRFDYNSGSTPMDTMDSIEQYTKNQDKLYISKLNENEIPPKYKEIQLINRLRKLVNNKGTNVTDGHITNNTQTDVKYNIDTHKSPFINISEEFIDERQIIEYNN
jgi:hypothetical protein